MKLLIDTHILIWSAANKLPARVAPYILEPSNTLLFSPASIWEIAIKRSKGREDFQINPYRLYKGLLESGYEELTITTKHALAVEMLPDIHNDPFDRILLAQSMSESIHLLTCGADLANYSLSVIYAG